MDVYVCSFSYKEGIPACPDGAPMDFVFDCRGLPNPYSVEALRPLTGLDAPVADFMSAHREEVQAFLLPVRQLVQDALRACERDGRGRLAVAFGCRGGRHRSVYCAEAMAEFLRACESCDVETVHARLRKMV